MLVRKIQNIIKEHFKNDSNKILIIDGARQIGKSYIIRFVGKQMFGNFIEVNMLDDKREKRRFEHVSSVDDFYMSLSAIAGSMMKEKENTLVFIDEIQAYPQLLTLLKFLQDDGRFTYIVSGSQLGIALHETLSVPGGRIRIEHMYPLDFEEFLWANDFGEEAISFIRKKFESCLSLDESTHRQLLGLFRKYLLIGGLPDAVNKFVETHNIVLVREVHEQIRLLYEEDASQYDTEHKLSIKRVYQLLPSYLENRKKRVVFNAIEGKKGKRGSDYLMEFEYLVSSGIALEVKAISNPSFPLVLSCQKSLLKLYLNDVGLLTNVMYQYNIDSIMRDEASVNLGSVYESVVASELRAHGYDLYYYDNRSKGEVDFLIDDYDTLSSVPVEVKSGKDYTIHRALDRFASNEDYQIKKALVLSNEREVLSKGKMVYLPIYYVMFLKPSSPKQVIL